MKIYLLFLIVSAFVSRSTIAHAETAHIYNDKCELEIHQFQQASNTADQSTSRHALILCLADDSYLEANQKSSGFKEWPETSHFKIYASKSEVEIGTVILIPQVNAIKKTETNSTNGGMIALSGGGSSCSCPENFVVRTPSDPNGPLKSQDQTYMMTVNIGALMAGDQKALNRLEDVVDTMKASPAAPYNSNNQAAVLVNKYADFENTLSNLNGTAFPTFGLDDYGNNQYAKMAETFAFENRHWYTNQTASAAETLTGNCCCNQDVVPIKRSGGDGTPSVKIELPEIWFHKF